MGGRDVGDVQGYVAPSLPRAIEIGGEDMLLRRMTAADADRLHAFFLAMPESDLLLLRRDVTDGRQINEWVAEIERGETVTLVAECGNAIMGEATLHLSTVPWTRHIAVVRAFTSHIQRGRGLGRTLLDEACHLAPSLGIERVVAELANEQAAAQGLLLSLGFSEEACLTRWVKDRAGHLHDLVMMTADVRDPDLPEMTVDAPGAWHCTACGVVTRLDNAPDRCPDCGAGPGFLVRSDEE